MNFRETKYVILTFLSKLVVWKFPTVYNDHFFIKITFVMSNRINYIIGTFVFSSAFIASEIGNCIDSRRLARRAGFYTEIGAEDFVVDL